MRTINRLTPLKVARLKKPGRYGDGLGLWLQVSRYGTKAWLFRYQREGKARQMGLGPLHTVTLAKARDKATACRRLLLDGVDPLEAKRQRRTTVADQKARALTFKQAAEKYIAANERHWKNAKHATQWSATLETYAFPILGTLPVDEIDKNAVIRAVEPIWEAKRETANRVRGRIETVLNWAVARGYRKEGDNPARWKGHLEHALPKLGKKVRHQPALPYAELPAFMAELRNREGASARALEFTILNMARTGAVIGATWNEVDLDEQVWTVPPERAGAKIIGENTKPRRVPLSPRSIEILKSLPREKGNPHVFIGAKKGTGLSNMAMLELMRKLRPKYVPHGFRSTFKDWCAERTNYPNEVSEAALWHAVADKVEAAYRRGQLFEKRRLLADEWQRYCETVACGDRKVIRIRGASREPNRFGR